MSRGGTRRVTSALRPVIVGEHQHREIAFAEAGLQGLERGCAQLPATKVVPSVNLYGLKVVETTLDFASEPLGFTGRAQKDPVLVQVHLPLLGFEFRVVSSLSLGQYHFEMYP